MFVGPETFFALLGEFGCMVQSYISKTLFRTTNVRHSFEVKDVEGSKEIVITDSRISATFFHTIRHDAKRRASSYSLKRKRMKDRGRLQEEGR